MNVVMRDAVLTVSHEELSGSPVEKITEGGIRCERHIKCAWSDRFQLFKELLGYYSYDEPSDTMNWYYPHKYPNETQFQNVFAKDIASCTAFNKSGHTGDDTEVNSYEFAELKVIYATPDYGDSEEFTQESFTPSADTIQFPTKNLFWNTAVNGEKQKVNETEVIAGVAQGGHWAFSTRMSNIPSTILDDLGTVNDDVVYSPKYGWGFPAGTLAMKAPTIEDRTDSSGNLYHKVTFNFEYQRMGWNRFPRSQDEEGNILFDYVSIGEQGSVINPYPPADLGKYIT